MGASLLPSFYKMLEVIISNKQIAEFDKTLRDIVQNIPQRFISILTGKKGVKILDNTFPSTKERVADMVLQLEDNSIFYLKLQTQNDKNMPFRMLGYYLLLK